MADPYELFCLADPVFYDVVRASADTGLADFPIASRALPPGWARTENDEWLVCRPDAVELPSQGWKVHVSACPANAERVLDAVWGYCVDRGLAFKFLRSPQAHFLRNSKQAARGHSGKLVTAYPADVAEMEVACKELDGLLGGEPGPYILSDLRWGAGPVHVRYGGFVERRCLSPAGDLVLALEDSTGTLVPDERPPAFTLPPWVPLPECLAPHLEARNAVTVADLPYRVERALLFSNGGGVYTGTDVRSGDRVVLKEGRPHAGLTGDDADAVTRLRNEHAVLCRLAGIEGVPGVRDVVDVGEHLFLVLDFVEGKPLNRHIVHRNPGLGRTADPAACADYTAWAMGIHAEVERIMGAIHARGVAYADLHPRNLLVDDEGRVTLIDYEVAYDAADPRPQELAAPGFRAPRDRVGTAVDDYALACLRLGLFVPLTHLFGLDPRKARELAGIVSERFPVPRYWLDEAVRTITGGEEPAGAAATGGPGGRAIAWDARPGAWPATRTALVRAIVASATPGRDDRLFPGDVAQFRTGGTNLAHGAAGVLYALSTTGAGRFPDYEDWLVDHAKDRAEEPRLGFYEGLHGVAYALEHLGHPEPALDVVDACLAERWEETTHDLRDGLAGIGLNLAHLGRVTGEAALGEAAVRAAEVLAARLGAGGDGAHSGDGDGDGARPYAGLMRGWAGPALLFVRLYEATGDVAFLEPAAAALRRDLGRCTVRDDDPGVMHVDEGWRTMPYLATGSVGIGMVVDRYLAHRHDERFAEASAAIHEAARSWFYVEPGLFEGRAGMVAYLAGRGAGARPSLREQAGLLGWHALGYGGGIAFPGERLMRLSMDLATGTAGVLLALGAAFHDEPVHLPFLAPFPELVRPLHDERR